MPIEIVFRHSFDHVQQAAREALTECGYRITETPMPAGNRVKMCMWGGEKGNKLLSMVLGFIFKLERVQVMMTAYQDGSTALAVYEGGSSSTQILPGGLAGSAARLAHDAHRAGKAANDPLAPLDAKLREKLGAHVAYQGKIREGALPVMA
ncbi:MAG: hypothetical protein IT373_05820 [Polyangiaceae bacterium]|nr:hypothetical protein [Polyangiaceae bacterium]